GVLLPGRDRGSLCEGALRRTARGPFGRERPRGAARRGPSTAPPRIPVSHPPAAFGSDSTRLDAPSRGGYAPGMADAPRPSADRSTLEARRRRAERDPVFAALEDGETDLLARGFAPRDRSRT